jgi:sugar (pentulose or hexulose) kinase
MTATIAAIDLGASSGRVITARAGEGQLEITEVHRFPNRPVRVNGTPHWDSPALRSVIGPNDPAFMPPDDIPSRVAHYCVATGQPVPRTKPEVVRYIMDSLALGHRITIQQALELSGRRADVIHIVGGGAQNSLLCRLTADATGLPVTAGPVEATALGNVGVQARSLGLIPSLTSLRSLIAETQPLHRYEPTGSPTVWTDAATHLNISALAPAPA